MRDTDSHQLQPEKMERKLYESAVEGTVEKLLELNIQDPLILDRVAINGSSETPLHVAAMRGSESHEKPIQMNDEDEEGLEDEDTLCGACGDNYTSDEFWICCDICEVWFHGKCVKITPARAETIKQYECPSCINKRART